MAMRGIGSHAPRLKTMGSPKALGNRRSGRAGEPAAGESVGASESLDDAPQDPRLPSYPPVGPTDRLPDLCGSLSRTFGIIGHPRNDVLVSYGVPHSGRELALRANRVCRAGTPTHRDHSSRP